MKKQLFILGLIAVIATPPLARAEDTKETITLRPATIALNVAAGEVTLQTVYFTNQGDQRKSFTVLRSDYSFDPKDGKTLLFTDSGTTSDSVQSMLDFTPTNFELDAGQTQELLVRIRPDVSTRPGQYKGALFIGQTQQVTGSNSIQVVGRVGTIIGVTVTGSNPPVGAAAPFSARPSAIVIAIVLMLIFFFAGAGVLAARKARIRRKQLYL